MMGTSVERERGIMGSLHDQMLAIRSGYTTMEELGTV